MRYVLPLASAFAAAFAIALLLGLTCCGEDPPAKAETKPSKAPASAGAAAAALRNDRASPKGDDRIALLVGIQNYAPGIETDFDTLHGPINERKLNDILYGHPTKGDTRRHAGPLVRHGILDQVAGGYIVRQMGNIVRTDTEAE